MQSISSKGSAATMFWGTDGVLSGTLASAEVDSIDPSPVALKEEVDNNRGFTSGSFHGDNGWDASVNCIWQSGITWPIVGAEVLLKLPGDAAGKICVVEETPPAGVARKKAATIKFKVSYRPDRS